MNKEKIEKIIYDACENEDIPGLVAIVADSKGITYKNCFGTRDISTGAPVTKDTVFQVASMTKAVTAIAMMQLVEQRKVSLDTDIAEYVPEYGNQLVLEGWDENDVPKLHRARTPLTIRHLMAQTSGFPFDWHCEKMCKWTVHFGLYGKSLRRRDTDFLLKHVPLACDPGTEWNYGPGMDICGDIIEAVTGEALGEYFENHIFKPLNMTSSSFHLSPSMRERLMSYHAHKGEDGELVSIGAARLDIPCYGTYMADWDYGDGLATGGLFTSAEDFIKICRLLLNKGTYKDVKLLSPESVEEMHKNQIGDLVMDWHEPYIDFSSVLPDPVFYPGIPTKWGLGGAMLNSEETPEGLGAWSMSWFGVFNAYYWVDWEKDTCAVFMTATHPGADELHLGLYKKFMKAVYDRL